MPVCVYCRENLSEADFNTEHVLPEQLGTFENNLTLIQQVCRACNSYFGQTIERNFGRDSLEAIFRLMHGQKNPGSMGNSPGERVALRIPEPSRWAGAIVLLACGPDGKLVVTLTPQVGVRRRLAREFAYFLEQQVLHDPTLLTDLTSEDAVVLIARDTDRERLVELVRSRFPSFTVRDSGSIVDSELDIDGGKILIETKARVDRIVVRTAAKVAFNYLTYQTGSQFVLDRSFDRIRRFIRLDEGDWRDFVRVTTEPILAQETVSFRETDGHVITLNWLGTRILKGQFSPYNYLNYQVVLTGNYSGIWRDIRYGNVFDWESRMILDMVAPRLVSLDPKRAARAAEALMPRAR